MKNFSTSQRQDFPRFLINVTDCPLLVPGQGSLWITAFSKKCAKFILCSVWKLNWWQLFEPTTFQSFVSQSFYMKERVQLVDQLCCGHSVNEQNKPGSSKVKSRPYTECTWVWLSPIFALRLLRHLDLRHAQCVPSQHRNSACPGRRLPRRSPCCWTVPGKCSFGVPWYVI